MLPIHIDILMFLLENGTCPTNVLHLEFPKEEIMYLCNLEYVEYIPISYTDRTSYYRLTSKGREFLILHEQQTCNSSQQIHSEKNKELKSVLYNLAVAVIIYLLGLFTDEIKSVVFSFFHWLSSLL